MKDEASYAVHASQSSGEMARLSQTSRQGQKANRSRRADNKQRRGAKQDGDKPQDAAAENKTTPPRNSDDGEHQIDVLA